MRFASGHLIVRAHVNPSKCDECGDTMHAHGNFQGPLKVAEAQRRYEKCLRGMSAWKRQARFAPEAPSALAA